MSETKISSVTFGQMKCLETHISCVHDQTKDNICKIYNNRFSKRENKTHIMNVHEKKKDFKCDLCDSFSKN